MSVTFTGFENYMGRGSWLPDRVPNAVLDILMQPTSAIITLQEVKDDLKIEFDNEDDFITDLILLCQSHVETFCGVSLSQRTVNAVLCNRQQNIELPYGPVISLNSALDQDGNDISDQVVLQGVSFQWLNAPCFDYINIDYQAGYQEGYLPLDLKKAVKQEIAFRYSHRTPGTAIRAKVNPGLCDEAIIYATPYVRNKFI